MRTSTWTVVLYPLDIENDPTCLFFACAERSRSIRITSPDRSSRPPSGERNDPFGSLRECFIPLAGKITAHI